MRMLREIDGCGMNLKGQEKEDMITGNHIDQINMVQFKEVNMGRNLSPLEFHILNAMADGSEPFSMIYNEMFLIILLIRNGIKPQLLKLYVN
jgi:hypothetical protein